MHGKFAKDTNVPTKPQESKECECFCHGKSRDKLGTVVAECVHCKPCIQEKLKTEIRVRLEYATTSGENLDYAVNSMYELFCSSVVNHSENSCKPQAVATNPQESSSKLAVSEWEELFDKGNYLFRFEYDDKNGRRRFEIGCINDNVPRLEAAKMAQRHTMEYGATAENTDFVENKWIKSFIRTLLLTQRKELGEKVEGMKVENPYRDKEINKNDPLKHYAKIHQEVGHNKALNDVLKLLNQ